MNNFKKSMKQIGYRVLLPETYELIINPITEPTRWPGYFLFLIGIVRLVFGFQVGKYYFGILPTLAGLYFILYGPDKYMKARRVNKSVHILPTGIGIRRSKGDTFYKKEELDDLKIKTQILGRDKFFTLSILDLNTNEEIEIMKSLFQEKYDIEQHFDHISMRIKEIWNSTNA